MRGCSPETFTSCGGLVGVFVKRLMPILTVASQLPYPLGLKYPYTRGHHFVTGPKSGPTGLKPDPTGPKPVLLGLSQSYRAYVRPFRAYARPFRAYARPYRAYAIPTGHKPDPTGPNPDPTGPKPDSNEAHLNKMTPICGTDRLTLPSSIYNTHADAPITKQLTLVISLLLLIITL